MKNLEENWWRRITLVTQEQIAWVWNFNMYFAHIKVQGRSSIALIDMFLNAMEEETKPICIQSLTKLHIISNGRLLACLLGCIIEGLGLLSLSLYLSLFVFKASMQRCLLCCIMRTQFNTHLNYYTTVIITSVNPRPPGYHHHLHFDYCYCSPLGIENPSSRVLHFVPLLVIMITSWLELG
jgi:hypothetical protein